jgi:hypothetical protein|tara:strand:+ start:7408 stop:8907 length:1500 start_codon:yes stop_codon:yes gene_type:complete
MNLEHNILAVVEPSIMPTEIEIYAGGEEEGGPKQTKNIGNIEPSITVNKYTFGRDNLQSVSLDLSGIVPKLTCTVVDNKQAFDVDHYPRDGDTMVLLINSKNQDTFKSIHMDFDITEISNEREVDGEPPEITMSGIAKIPKLYAEHCQTLDSAGSLDHMELVARELGIGLATNIDTTDDSMSRIQAYETYLEFIKSIATDSYIDEESFTKFYIDQYYYLNYVEVNKIFNSENPEISDLQTSLASSQVSQGEDGDEEGSDPDDIEVPLMLTNNRESQGLNIYSDQVELINNSSKISLKAGNKRNVMIYDNNSDSDRLQQFDIEPLSSTNLRDIEEPLKGRRTEERYQDNIKFKYIGRQNAGDDGLGNTHANSIYSKLFQKQNEMETQKMKVKVTLSSFNPAIYKFQKIPLLMYHYDGVKIAAATEAQAKQDEAGFSDQAVVPDTGEREQEGRNSQMVDRFLTGFYIIENININYDVESGLSQEVTLIRREWPTKVADLKE